jgi:hypothetical protein
MSKPLRRWIEATLNGNDLDHLVSFRLHPNQIAIRFRLLARNLAIGLRIATAEGRPESILILAGTVEASLGGEK